MRLLTTLSILLALATWVPASLAQTQAKPTEEAPVKPAPLLTYKDSLLLTVEANHKYLHHPVKRKQTLFSLARYYGLSLQELYEHNPAFQSNPTLKVGSRVKIPTPNRAIRRYKGSDFVAANFTPIYYVVQNGDNLYQICKRYFGMPVDSVLKRNSLKDKAIHPGQRLLVGWMNTEGIPAKWRKSNGAPTPSSALLSRYGAEKSNRKEMDGQGVCFWQRDSDEKGDLYALHREAAINTPMAVTNPMNGRTVYAKVIGRIPKGYEKNVEVVLSPAAARQIGARDPRFFVRVKFLK